MNMPFQPTQKNSEATDDTVASDRQRSWRRAAFIGVPLLLAVGVASYVFRGPPPPPAMPTPVVAVATPLSREVNEWDDYIGRFEASRSVEVRPRVSGQITGLHFKDGQIVQKGQLLFTIDPRPFTAALAEARAAVASARSDLALARADLGRAERLINDDAVSKSEVDRLRARVQAAVAAVAGADARVRSRALDVEFTQVRAPIAGRISDRRVDPGNLVAAGEGQGSTLLTTINAVDPIYFSFNGSEGLFLKAKRARDAGNQPTPIQIRLQDESGYKWTGQLDFTDNGLDPRSGTIRGRATVANPDLFLTPGMFGNMRLSNGGTTKALLVPETAIQVDQARRIVLVAAKDGTVVAKPVDVGPVVDGLRIIRSGLAPQDRVIISGLQLVMPGGKVETRAGKIAPEVGKDGAAPVSIPVSGEATLTGR